MFEITPITLEFAIGPQPTAKDFAAVRNAGYAAVLNVRPDDENGNYLVSGDARPLAENQGLTYAHSPSNNHALFETDIIDRFERALTELPKPIFAHCKSGTRTAILWALVASRYRDAEEVIALCRPRRRSDSSGTRSRTLSTSTRCRRKAVRGCTAVPRPTGHP